MSYYLNKTEIIRARNILRRASNIVQIIGTYKAGEGYCAAGLCFRDDQGFVEGLKASDFNYKFKNTARKFISSDFPAIFALNDYHNLTFDEIADIFDILLMEMQDAKNNQD